MKRYYLIKVQSVSYPMFYISATEFNCLLDVCNSKGLFIIVYSSVMLHSTPTFVGPQLDQVLDLISKI